MILVCLAGADVPPHLLQTPAFPSYSVFLLCSVQNLQYVTSSTSRPLAIMDVAKPAHAQAVVRCGHRHGVLIRTGRHDYEGLSYASLDPRKHFAVLDLAALRDICVGSARAEAWVGSGATLGKVYYYAAAASRVLVFPTVICPTVGVGGDLNSGGFGTLMCRYGLAADNIIDNVLVDADGY